MRIVITGANSASGQAILRYAAEAGVASNVLVAAVRSERAADEIRPLLGAGSSLAKISYDDPSSLDAAFRGASAIIHLPGILVERAGSTYEHANVAPTRSVVAAAKRSAVDKFVLISATGADEKSSNSYYRSKGEAEGAVRASGLCYTILRAPLLLGPATEGAAALARNARGSAARLIGGGRNFQQPLYVDDWWAPFRCRTESSWSGRLACSAAGYGLTRSRKDCFRLCWPFVSASGAPDFRQTRSK